ncbi:flagellar hook-basal body complex protein FliE [Aquibacillus albus]|uniref:Flagellar hook-basal body complex protein FliE n=1 Tax=Aquibacillus albus TaxID=1168171 RepID=A0ABS2N107_9BACI|nr:flagellar hook-basal body complex protein FliE [Aquibacillus albus]MBM7571817.1 flagellar hook-basal body complex protein FliE [Aquibacillus albus]
MEINKLNLLQTPAMSLQPNQQLKTSPGEAQQHFASSLKSAIDQLNHAQIESDKKTQALARGEIDNLHDVMITSQKASVALQTAVEMQRKVTDAYKEIMRMQV